MFGKSKFYKKCKLATKLTQTRLEMIKKKRNAMQRYLKNDIADLLKNGLDKNAYDRAEGILVEVNLTYCYEFVEKFIGQILNNVSSMDKQSECPEDCRESVSSLIFAAARFADLPDLRDLRNIFTQRYGASLDSYVNKEFVDKLKLAHPTQDMKLQLMQDVAEESGVQWNRNDAEEKLFNHLSQGTNSVIDDKFHNSDGLDDKKLTDNPVRKSKPKPISVRRRHSKLNFNEDDVGVSSVGNEQDSKSDQKSGLIRHGSCDVSTSKEPSVEQQDTKKGHRIRSCSAQPERTQLPDYDDLVARLAAIREVHGTN